MTRAEVRRAYRNAGIGFAIGLALGAAVIAARPAMLGWRPVAALVVDGAANGALGAAFAMMVSSVRIARRTSLATGTDSGTRRRIARVVLRGKKDELSDEEQRRAARFAVIKMHSLPFEIVPHVTLAAGILAQTVASIVWPPRGIDPARFRTMDSFFFAGSGLFVVVAPAMMMRARRHARRWAAMRAGL